MARISETVIHHQAIQGRAVEGAAGKSPDERVGSFEAHAKLAVRHAAIILEKGARGEITADANALARPYFGVAADLFSIAALLRGGSAHMIIATPKTGFASLEDADTLYELAGINATLAREFDVMAGRRPAEPTHGALAFLESFREELRQ